MGISKKIPLIIGFVSKRGCGKDACSRYIVRKYGAKEITMSSYMSRAVNFFQLPTSRSNLVWLITKLRSRFGKGILARAVIREIQEDGFSIYILNGVRIMREIEILRETFGRKFVLVDIACSDKIRFDRVKKREKRLKVSKDNVNMALADFVKQERHIVTEIEIPTIEKKADYLIENNGSMEELHKNLDELIKKCKS
jgi:dephospho-CoA kinase